ncbi:MAG: transcriptional repressor LexA [Actinobacteria bacterium ATB1]|nr:transcriptional repressor LexA [Actinobacteria bacterium ATB1]
MTLCRTEVRVNGFFERVFPHVHIFAAACDTFPRLQEAALGGDELTARQKAVLQFIAEETRERGYPPSVREIGEAVGLTSSSSVHAQLATLQRLGYIKRDPTKPRALEIHFDAESGNLAERRPPRFVPLVGEIAAGQPILAAESVEEAYPLPADWVGDSGTLFMLSVKGDSMIGAGILDGDYVVVRQQADARNGEIVAAMVEGPDGAEATVKRFVKQGRSVVLVPENPDMGEMVFDSGVEILGKVVAVMRRV